MIFGQYRTKLVLRMLDAKSQADFVRIVFNKLRLQWRSRIV